ncbi:MAG: hypothetical protein ACQKBT_12405 [Puniceicoccales bacterium]
MEKERVYEDVRRVRMTEWENGDSTTYTYEMEGGREIVRQFVDGQWQWTRIWNRNGQIVYGKNKEGFESIFRYGADAIREVLQKRPDGEDFLVRSQSDGSTRITDPEQISAWLSNHARIDSTIDEGLSF